MHFVKKGVVMKRFNIQKLHPVSVLILFIQTLITCFVAEKTGLLVIFSMLFIFSVIVKKAKTVLWSLPLAVFMFVLNPVFYHGGETILFSIGRTNFTLEAVENGLYCALLILCTTLIFTVLGGIISEEKFLYVFGRILPKTALMISMIFKHFDLLSESYKQCRDMAKISGIYENDKTLLDKLKTNAVIFEAFTGAALEGSLDTALSLSSKGYYNKNKTKIKLYHFKVYDFIFIVASTLIFVCTFLNFYYNLIAIALLFFIPIIFSERRINNG